MGMNNRTLRPSATGFSPRSISGLALWLDASDGATLFQNSDGTVPATASSDPVGYWADKSGNGRHAVQATAGNRPVVGTLNSRKALTFDGSNDNLFVEDYPVEDSLSGMTRFIVFDPDATASMIFASTSTSAKTQNAGGATWWQRFGSNWYGYAADGVRYHGGTADESPHVATNFFDGTLAASFGTRLQNYIDGALLPVVGSLGTLGTTTGASGAKLSIGSNLGINNFVNGKILEVLSYTRALTTAERRRAERYLAAKWGITLAPQVDNADAQDWVNRVYANGGTVSTATAGAVNTFCESIASAGIRDRFYRLNLFCGTGLNAALVPLFRGPSLGGTQLGNTTDTNVGPFVSGDYVESAGLTGTGNNGVGAGNSKHLRTGLTPATVGFSSGHLSAFIFGLNQAAPNQSGIIAIRENGNSQRWWLEYRQASMVSEYTGNNFTTFATPVSSTNSHIILSRTSLSSLRYFQNGSQVGSELTTPVSGTGGTSDWPVFATLTDGAVNGYAPFRMGGYSIGTGMTPTQAASYNTAMQAFQTVMSRA